MKFKMHHTVIGLMGLSIAMPGLCDDDEQSDETKVIPSHVIPEKLIFDLDYVSPGSEHVVIVPIHNPLDAWIWIDKVTPECPCLQIMDLTKEFKPFETGEIRIKFIAPDEPVTYSKQVHLITSHPQYERISITIQARVGIPLKLEQSVIDLGTMIQGEFREVHVPIINDGEKIIRLAYGLSDDPSITLQLAARSIAPGENSEIVLYFKPMLRDDGPHEAHITVYTNAKSQKTLQLNVMYSINDAYRLLTPVIEIDSESEANKFMASIVVESRVPNGTPDIIDAAIDSMVGTIDAMEVLRSGRKIVINCRLNIQDHLPFNEGLLKLQLADHPSPVLIPIRRRSQ